MDQYLYVYLVSNANDYTSLNVAMSVIQQGLQR